MSTTYYIRKKLSKEEKKEIKKYIDKDLYEDAERMMQESCEKREIGHRAGGWKFSWYPFNIYLKDLTRKGIEDLIYREDIIVYNEYGEVEDKKKFLDMAFNWYVDGWDSNAYQDEHPNETRWSMLDRQNRCTQQLKMSGHTVKPVFKNMYQTDFENDGLRWTILE